MSWIIKVEHLSKIYRLGASASQRGTLYEQFSKKIKNYIPGKKAELETESTEDSAKMVVSNAQTEGLPAGYFWALKDISFQVNPGERIGLIGQNGSGKSTLLKILSRITKQTHGEFRYRGHLISLLEVGTGFHPELSGRENIYLNAAINGMTRQQIKNRFKNIVDFSELGRQIDTPVKRYSSGMYMRLAFSVAAFLESEILLIDEVLAVGDNHFQKKCKEKMLELANDGRSVIFVSHDMNAIESICKKTIEMSHGEIVAIKDLTIIEQASQDAIILHSEQVSTQNTPTLSTEPVEKKALLLSYLCANEQGERQEQFTVDESILFKIQFEVLTASKLVLRLDLSTSKGVILCTMMDHHLFQAQNALRKPGLYEETVSIPKAYLNEGEFYLSIYVIDVAQKQIQIANLNCLHFKVVDYCLPSGVRSSWEGPWPESLLRPQFNWDVQYASEEKCITME